MKGFQEAPEAPGTLLAGATCKHFVANSMENSTEVGVNWNRHNFDANVSMQDLVSDYMVPFQACIETAQASGLMCSCERPSSLRSPPAPPPPPPLSPSHQGGAFVR